MVSGMRFFILVSFNMVFFYDDVFALCLFCSKSALKNESTCVGHRKYFRWQLRVLSSAIASMFNIFHIKTISFPHQALPPLCFLLPTSHTSLPCGLQDKCGIAYIQATARSFPLLSVLVDTPTP